MYTQLVIILLAVMVWRAIWNILDCTLYPTNQLISDILSLLIGIITCPIMLVIQMPIDQYLQRVKASSNQRIVVDDFMCIIGTWTILCLWRGAWNLCKTILLPDPFVGGFFFHTFGTFGLLILQGLSNIGSNNLQIDSVRPRSEDLFFFRVYSPNTNEDEQLEPV